MKILPLLLFCFLFGELYAQQLDQLKNQKPLIFQGGGTFQLDWYQVNDNAPRQQPFTIFLAGTPTLSVYGLDLPFRLFVSNHQRGIQQPLSQLGISPEYKWAKLHLGYNDLFFSPYTLANHRFLGTGAELTPGKWRIGLAYGRFQKPIAQEFLNVVPDEDAYLLDDPIPAFKRNAGALKLGYGEDRSFVDLIFLKGKDQLSTFDSIQGNLLQPVENTVTGLSFSLGLGPNLTWTGNSAVSGFSRDLEADSLSLEDFPAQGLLEQLLYPRESSNLTFAGDSKLTFRKDRFQLAFQYKRIDPGFQSIGAYFFQTDLEQFNLQSNFALAQGKFSFNGLLGKQRDNLYQLRNTTGNRLIANANLNWNPNQHFGINLNYANFGISQDPVTNSSLNDTLLLRQVSHNLTLVPRWMWMSGTHHHMINVVGGWFVLADLREDAMQLQEARTKMLNVNYVLRLAEQQWQLQFGLMARSTIAGLVEQRNIGGTVAIGKSWQNNKIRLRTELQYFRNKLAEEAQGNTFRWKLQLRYRLNKSLSWTTDLRGLNNRDPQRSFSELRAGTGLSFNF